MLKVIDNQVDQQTGTIRLKAEFPNDKRQLWPGQFVNVRLLVDTLKNVVVAPTEAIQRGPDGPYVYVVGSDNTVVMRAITIARQDEKQAVIAKGVTAGRTRDERLRPPEGRRDGHHQRRAYGDPTGRRRERAGQTAGQPQIRGCINAE